MLIVFYLNAQAQTDSLTVIIEKAKQGDAIAQNELGIWYYSGKHVKQDYEQALQWWAKSAQQKNVQAIGNMGLCYQFGRGIEKDSLTAMQLYLRAIEMGNAKLLKERTAYADKGDIFNSVLAALCCQRGVGQPIDMPKFFVYMAQAAKANSVDAQRELALELEKAKNVTEAAQWYKQAANNGDVLSQYRYGRLLLKGEGVKPDKQQAVIYWLKAAEAGNAQAQCDLGNLYYQGKDIMQNHEQAAQWFLKSAYQGFNHAQWNMGVCYMKGEGVNRDYDQAIYWFGEAIANGYKDTFQKLCNDSEKGWKDTPFHTYLKGMVYYSGQTPDIAEAVKCFKLCDKQKIIEAKTTLGICHINKNWKGHNLKKAVKFLKKASESNSPTGQFYLGTLYETGKGVNKDMDQAISLYRQAANSGLALAQCYLGDMFYEGRGVEQDYVQAVRYYCMAEEQNQLTSTANKRLASCYEDGLGGVAVDKKKAAALLKKDNKNNISGLLKLVAM